MQRLWLVTACCSLLLAGCGDDTGHGGDRYRLVTGDDTVLVEVDGQPITLPMLEFVMEARGIAEDDVDGMREVLDELIRRQATANAAAREGLSSTPALRAERLLADTEIQARNYIERFQAENPVTDGEIEAVYREQRERAGESEFRLETIEFPDQAAALEQLDAIRDGESTFEQALKQAGEQGRVARRTDWVDGSQVPPDFLAVLQATGAGEVVEDLLNYQGRWQLVRLEGRRPFEPPALDEVREGIRRTLMARKTQAMIQQLFEAAQITPMLPLEDSDGVSPDQGN